jgi:arginase
MAFGLMGVPSSAGAKTPGIEKAPLALREAGVVEQLREAGLKIVDHGDLVRRRYTPDKAHFKAQNLNRVIEVAREVAQSVGAILKAGQKPLVLGGDCSVSVGAVAAMVQYQPEMKLLYIDGGLDLSTPETTVDGNLDSMGVAHMIGETGANETLSHIGTRYPLLSPEQVIYFGCEPDSPDHPEERVLRKHAMSITPAEAVRGRARDAAAAVLTTLQHPFLIHFDVDVIDFVDFPIADVPLFNRGLTFAEAMESLAVFAASPLFAGLVITEINPDHTDNRGIEMFVDALVGALQSET